jgi:hypothetical protein
MVARQGLSGSCFRHGLIVGGASFVIQLLSIVPGTALSAMKFIQSVWLCVLNLHYDLHIENDAIARDCGLPYAYMCMPPTGIFHKGCFVFFMSTHRTMVSTVFDFSLAQERSNYGATH